MMRKAMAGTNEDKENYCSHDDDEEEAAEEKQQGRTMTRTFVVMMRMRMRMRTQRTTTIPYLLWGLELCWVELSLVELSIERRGRCTGIFIIRMGPIGRYIIHRT